jgi:hypothetical protein
VQPTYDSVVGHTTVDGDVTVTAREAWLRTVTIATIVDDVTFTISDPADGRVVDDWFARGWFAINGNYNLAFEVRAYVASTKTVSLWMPLTGLLTVGDVIDISPGCNLVRTGHCATRFSNAVNFHGEG